MVPCGSDAMLTGRSGCGNRRHGTRWLSPGRNIAPLTCLRARIDRHQPAGDRAEAGRGLQPDRPVAVALHPSPQPDLHRLAVRPALLGQGRIARQEPGAAARGQVRRAHLEARRTRAFGDQPRARAGVIDAGHPGPDAAVRLAVGAGQLFPRRSTRPTALRRSQLAASSRRRMRLSR